ncbi:MAG: spiro-SPASM protein [Bacteroides sp.]|nr:spiro-SPASM protein [Prevotella sp.]MCM1407796.1 spiro-SPASM protein [Treponema brennaborense]MCM1468856.1 spiro-SPASM protein [Bacteroides sp.]
MKTLVILNAAFVSSFACERVFGGKSAVERSLEWARTVPNCAGAAVLVSSENPHADHIRAVAENAGIPVQITEQNLWTMPVFFAQIKQLAEGFDAVAYAYADCPFYDADITEKLYDALKKYAAEYCFADGYPYGVAPEFLDAGLAGILSALCAEKFADSGKPIERDAVFSLMKTDINSFEIETVIAPHDFRYLRLNFCCGTKRDFLLCRRLFEKCGGAVSCDDSERDICRIAESDPMCLRTLPAYYEIQLASFCPGTCTICPYPAAYLQKTGHLPHEAAAEMSMPFGRFAELVSRIADFSGDAVISLSAWGEPFAHPDIEKCIAEVLRFPSLSLVIETCGYGVNDEALSRIADVCSAALPRRNGLPPIIWIVGIDAADESMYRRLHGENSDMTFEKAHNLAEKLMRCFPESVYPQFVRTTINEEQLEAFYRCWRSFSVSAENQSGDRKNGKLIVQKYNSFSGLQQDLRPADLSPIRRFPCWHLRRDMVILADGTVPLCKNALLSGFGGNVFADSLENIWKRSEPTFCAHMQSTYNGICEKCDEYYTFNF